MPLTYMRVIKDMYDGVRTKVRTLVGDTDDFPIDMGASSGVSAEPFSFYYCYGRAH